MANDEPVNLVELRAERNAARHKLGAAFVDNLIDADELQVRLDGVESAGSIHDLQALVADILPPSPPPPPPPPPAPATLPGEVAEVARISSWLSDTKKAGVWTPARTNLVHSILGNVRVDLREAKLAPGAVTELRMLVVLGEAHLWVPPGINLEVDCQVILGSQDQEETATPDPTAPRIRVTGHVVLGSLEIRERLPGEGWFAARKRRKLEQKARR